MSLLFDKIEEVFKTLAPVVALVLLISLTIVDVKTDVIISFVVGSILLLIGLTVFLWGVDLAMNPIGEHMSKEVATSKISYQVGLTKLSLRFLNHRCRA